jgi:hypothetical protein
MLEIERLFHKQINNVEEAPLRYTLVEDMVALLSKPIHD